MSNDVPSITSQPPTPSRHPPIISTSPLAVHIGKNLANLHGEENSFTRVARPSQAIGDTHATHMRLTCARVSLAHTYLTVAVGGGSDERCSSVVSGAKKRTSVQKINGSDVRGTPVPRDVVCVAQRWCHSVPGSVGGVGVAKRCVVLLACYAYG